MTECFDSLKRAIPCPVVRVPEPGAWELAIAVVCLVAMYGMVWGRKR